MPIRNLSDRNAALPTIGELRKGEAKQPLVRQGKPVIRDGEPVLTFGKDLGESFRFTSDAPLVEQAFRDLYGDEPKEILCLLAGATADEAFEAWNEEFSASALKHRCDGYQMVYQRDERGQERRWALGEGPACPYAEKENGDRPRDACKPHGRLKIIPVVQDGEQLRIADLRRIGQILVLTTSKNDIASISRALHWYERLHKTLAGVPFVLRRVPEKISTPRSDGKRARVEKWLLDITPSQEWVSLKLESMRVRAFSAVPGAPAAESAVLVGRRDDVRYDESETVEREVAHIPVDRIGEIWGDPPARNQTHDSATENTRGSIEVVDGPITEDDVRWAQQARDGVEAFATDRTENSHDAIANGQPTWWDTEAGKDAQAVIGELDAVGAKYSPPGNDATQEQIRDWTTARRSWLKTNKR